MCVMLKCCHICLIYEVLLLSCNFGMCVFIGAADIVSAGC